MNKYRVTGFRSVRALTMDAAAQIFATRRAKRKFGRQAYATFVYPQGNARDTSFVEYCSSIGYSTPGDTTCEMFYFTVHVDNCRK